MRTGREDKRGKLYTYLVRMLGEEAGVGKGSFCKDLVRTLGGEGEGGRGSHFRTRSAQY